MEEKKRIRFIDSHYHTLFNIADGDSIEIVYPDGKKEERVCTYIDEYHTQVGARVFHICEFAEIMEANGKSYCPARNREKEVEERKLPTRKRKPEISVWKGAGVEDWNYRCRPFIPEKTPFSQLGMYETLRLLEGAGI